MAAQRLPDPYNVLGLARGATRAQVKSAHRAMAKRYHPDAPEGDAGRFLQVQEAYKLLSDPLRRRDWDARHAPGPVRADEHGGPRVRRPASPPRPEPRRPARSRSTSPAPPGPPPAAEPDDAAEQHAAGGPAWTAAASADFDVYDRSSGAAWSSAARAYFRRYDAELPRHGSFHHQGTQPLTAARARAAADEEARRRARSGTGATAPRGAAAGAAPPHAAPPHGAPAHAAPAHAVPRNPAPARGARPTAAPPRRPYAYAGVARDSAQVSMLRKVARRAARSARWPSLGQRMLYALLAWIPLAVLIGYGGAAAAGCDVGGAACPTWFVPAQSVASALALGLLVALPRVAFLGAAGGVGAAAAGIGTVVLLEVLGRRPPPTPALLGAAGLLLAAVYLGVIAFLLLNQRLLPWYVPRPLVRARVPHR